MWDETRFRRNEIVLLLVKFALRLAGILFLWSATRCLLDESRLVGFFPQPDYSAGVIRLTGVIQFICGVGLLLPKTQRLTALVTGAILLLAGVSEIHQQQAALQTGAGWKLIVPGLCLLIPVLVRHYITQSQNRQARRLPRTERKRDGSATSVRRSA